MKPESNIYRQFIIQLTDEAKINKNKQIPSAVMIETTDRIAHILWLPPVLTYEMIVMMNLLDPHPVLMSDDEITRKEELLFYETHRNIETILYGPLTWVMTIADTLQVSDDEVLVSLKCLATVLQEVIEIMVHLYKNFSPDAFLRFRGFFTSILYRNVEWVLYPWPSWASSASFPIIDIIIGIERLPPLSQLSSRVMPVLQNHGYATLQDIEKVSKSVEMYGDFSTRFSHNQDVKRILHEIVNKLKSFRLIHASSVRKFLPEAYNGTAGTWWAQDIPRYLEQIIDNTKKHTHT